MKNVLEISARLEEISLQVEALSAVALEEGDSTEETLTQLEGLNAEFDVLAAKKDRLVKVQAKVDSIVASRVLPTAPAIEAEASIEPTLEENDPMTIPAKALYNSSKVFATSEDAYTSGQFLAAVAGNKKSQEFMAAQTVGTNSEGGFTVPAPLAAELINLLDSYGVARNVCKRVVMGAPTWSVPKLASGSTVYYPAEAAAITESALAFSQITLTAVKMASLVKMSTEISEDSLISMADTIVQDIAWSFSKAEDDNLFTGGSLYTGGIEADASIADTNIAGALATGLTLADLVACQVAVGSERGLNHEWYFNATLWNGTIRELLNAGGGITSDHLVSGVKPTLFGYPVNLVNAMPGNAASTIGDLIGVFGDLKVSHYFGDRRNLSFKVLNELFAVNDQVGIVATQRVDIASANPEVLSKITLTT
tara:strand:+ start:223 stop:1494 length:1272 start_codon:yes stop_codon:yes gene_type:complete